jgi:ribosomal protein S18 acetylase RimI-like enzyme
VGVLDNPVWHALAGPQQTLAERHGRAVRFDPAYTPFAALPDDPTADDWADLRALVGTDGIAVVARDSIDPPDDWVNFFAAAGTQMVWDGGSPDLDGAPPMQTLGPPDVPEILELVARAQPGPFAARTVELGPYVGIRIDGRLVAMAGCRMHIPGYVEVSAVCTDAEFRGQGLASAVVRRVVAEILDTGETPCLHAVAENITAIRLYDELGFTTRREIPFAALRPV